MKTLLLILAGVIAADARCACDVAKLTYSELIAQVRAGDVETVKIRGNQAEVCLKDGSTAVTVLPSDYRPVLDALQKSRVSIEFEEPNPVLNKSAPFLLLAGVWFVILVIRKPQLRVL